MVYGLWTMDAMDNGRWTMDNGRWTMDDGRWTMDNGRWTMDYGLSIRKALQEFLKGFSYLCYLASRQWAMRHRLSAKTKRQSLHILHCVQ
jgi:hypothetical protein